MRADRLIATLLLLQQNGRLSARRIAAELEVSRRTVMRDLEALGAAGVPIYAIRGPRGGYELWEGYRAQLDGLTNDEVIALPLWGNPFAAGIFGYGDSLHRARMKIASRLPDAMRLALAEVDGMFLHDRPVADPALRETLVFLAKSIRRARVIRAGHPAWSGRVVALDPLAIVESSEWFLVADVDGRREAVTVADLSAVAPTGRRFHRPDRYDLAGFWKDWPGRSRDA